MSPLRRATTWSIELRLWVAGCVVALAAFATRAQGLVPDAAVLALIGCSTLALYNLDGSLDAPGRGQSPRRRRLHLLLTVLALAACVALLTRVGGAARALVMGGLVVCGAYAVPITRAASGEPSSSLRLKALPGIKAPFVGFAVAAAVVWVPRLAAAAGGAGSSGPSDPALSIGAAAVLTLGLGLAATCNAVLFDVPDLGEDRRGGIPTWPARRGLRATRGRCLGLCAALLMLAGALALRGGWGPGVPAGLGVLGGALVAGTFAIRPTTSRRAVALWIDGALILPWAVMMAVQGAS